jgi:hypothetical protein
MGALLVPGLITCERKVAALEGVVEPNQLSDELDVTMQEEPPKRGLKLKRKRKGSFC